MKRYNKRAYTKRRNKRKLYLVTVFFLLLSIGLGYAYLQSVLTFSGTTKISKNNWDIHFDNLTSTDNTKVSIQNNTSVVLNVTLNPGEEFTYTVDAVNNGTIDAKIGSITPISVPAAYQDVIEYNLNYDNPDTGEEISVNDVLRANTREKITFYVKYKDEEDLEDDVEGVTLNLNFTINYVQADNNITEVAHKHPMCIKATTLHQTTCQMSSSHGCSGARYSSGSPITYGHTDSTKLVNGQLTSGTSTGYALDCDLTGTGTNYNERFYYVSDLMYYDTTNSTVAYDSDYAVLIYYSNVENKVATPSSKLAYYTGDANWYGASSTFMSNMPLSTDWKNTLKRDGSGNSFRQLVDNTGATSGNGNTYVNYDYTSYGGRLLTYQEVVAGCGGNTNLHTKCEFLMENTGYDVYDDMGYWLDTPDSDDWGLMYSVFGRTRSLSLDNADDTMYNGLRPAIEVLKSNISLE